MNPFGSVTFTFSLPNHLRSSRAVNYSLKVSIYENNDTLIKSEEKTIEAQNTVIKFSTIPINKYIYATAEVISEGVVVYSGTSELIRTKKGDNNLVIDLDKFYTIKFSFNGTSKVISVKPGAIIPISEIPKVQVNDGQAVIWLSDNTPFNFTAGITRNLELSANVVDINASNVVEVLKTRYGDDVHNIKVRGQINANTINDIAETLRSFSHNTNKYPLFNIDLSDTTGLSEVSRQLFAQCETLESIVFPESVTSIGDSLFYNTWNLKSVTFLGEISEIPSCTFYCSSELETVSFGGSVKSVGFSAFDSCLSLQSVDFLKTVEKIEDNAFFNCKSLTEVYIPACTTDIGRGAFSGCNGLTSFEVDSSNQFYAFEDGYLCDKNKTTIKACLNYDEEIIIPDYVEEIEQSVFSSLSNLKKVVIGQNIKKIDSYAFAWNRNLQSVVIPATVSEIRNGVFAGCQNLVDIQVDNNNEYYTAEKGIFYSKDKKTLISYPSASGEVVIPDFVTTIDQEAMRNNDYITKVVMGNNVQSIGSQAFYYNTNLSEITISGNISSVGNQAFENCEKLSKVIYAGTQEMWNEVSGSFGSNNNELLNANLTCTGEVQSLPDTNVVDVSAIDAARKISTLSGKNRVVVTDECSPETVSQIGQAIKNNSSASILLDLRQTSGLTEIPQEAFWECNSLVSITLPNTVTIVRGYAFKQCKNLTSVNLGNSVSTLEWDAFGYCEKLTTIVFPATLTEILEGCFNGCFNLTKITVAEDNPEFSVEGSALYNKAKTKLVLWPSASGEINNLPNTLEIIGYSAFNGSSITSIRIPDSVTTIDYGAFSGCNNLTSVDFGNGVSTIATFAFGWCNNLEEITIPASVTEIGDGVFSGSYNLSNINVEQGNEYYVSEGSILFNKDRTRLIAWSNASGEVIISNGVKKIGNYIFQNNREMTSVIVPDSVTSIGQQSFYGCEVLTSVELGDSVSLIDSYAFQCCRNLNSIKIPASVTKIGMAAFSECLNLETVTYTGTQELWNEIRIEDENYILNEISIYCTNEVTSLPINEVPVIASEAANMIYSLSGRTRLVVTDECSPETVSQIGQAIKNNSSASILLDLRQTSGLTDIPEEAFYECDNLVSIDLPNTVTVIRRDAFFGCGNLNSVSLGNSLQTMEHQTFRWCENIKEITLPATFQDISSDSFYGCSSLTKISVAEGNTSFIAEEGALYNNDKTRLIAWPSASGEINNLPNTLVAIDSCAFSVTNITSILIPDSVTSIGECAFTDCSNLISVNLGKKVSSISYSAFSWCRNLEEIIIPASVTEVGEGAFRECSSLNRVTYTGTEEMWNAISWNSENDCLRYAQNIDCTGDYTDIPTTGDTVTASEAVIKISTLSGRTRLVVTDECSPETVSEIGQAIKNNSDASILLDLSQTYGLTEIPEQSFMECNSLVSITLPNSVTSVYENAFYDCKNLVEIEFGNQIKTLENVSIFGCNSLKNVYIPASVENIGWGNFAQCPSLTEINVSEENQYFHSNNGALYSTNTLIAYPNASGSVEIPDGVEIIGNLAFYRCNELEEVVIPDSVTTIWNEAFDSCEKLERVTIGESVETIANLAFGRCENLRSITIPVSVTQIDGSIFSGCINLTDITIENDSYLVEDGIIYTADKKTLLAYPSASGVVEIEDGVENLGYMAFSRCRDLNEIKLPNSVTILNERAFELCDNLQTVNLGTNISEIGNYTFNFCCSVTEITIPASVTRIGSYAFGWCSNLTSVTFGNEEGWYYTQNSDYTEGTSIDVSNESTNATNFKDEAWANYYLYREQ